MSLPRSAGRTLAFTVAYVVATYAGRLTVMDGTNLSLVWPAAGVAAVWFLAQHTSRWRWLDALALTVVTLVVNTATGASPRLAAYFVVANLAQAYVFVYLFRRWLPHLWGGGGDRPLARLNELWRLIGAAVASTVCGAAIGPTGLWLVNGVYSWSATAVWLTRNTASILLIGAAGLRLGHLLYRRHTGGADLSLAGLCRRWASVGRWHRFEYLAVVLLSAAAYTVAFGLDHDLPLAFPLLVMTVWAGLRLHTGFVIVHDVVFGSAVVLFTLAGRGPFAGIPSYPTRALVAQVFVGMVAVVGLTLALSRDERVALIADLHTSRQAAAQQAELMTTIVQSMSEGLIVVDADGHVLIRNAAARGLLGTTGGDAGTIDDPAHYGLSHPDGTPATAEQMPYRRALAGDGAPGMDLLVRNPRIPEGRILRVTSTTMPGELDGVRYAVTVFHDVTAERRHRDELASFAGVVAHDLLNPLATVEGWTETLAEAFVDAPEHPVVAEATESLVRIKRASARMRNLINDLLAYTTARAAGIAPQDVSLADVVTDIATARIDQAHSNNHPVPVFHLADLHRVHADPVLLRQLLDNLINNAIKYTAPGVIPELRVATSVDGTMVTVDITDNGIGIPAGHHRSIFDNFHRAHRSSGYTGTGLGLGICQRIVERHGGTIGATDNPDGRGSRFTFTLPLAGSAVPTARDVENAVA